MESPDIASGVSAICCLNVLYTTLQRMTEGQDPASQRAAFAAIVVDQLKKKFKKEHTFWMSYLAFFDPKNGA